MPKTQVWIMGGGPSGLLLSQLLYRAGVGCIVLERHALEHVEPRIRAGLLGWTTVEPLKRFLNDPLSHKRRLAELDYLAESEAASKAVAENYTEQATKAP